MTSRLAQVLLPLTTTDASNTATTQNLPLTNLSLTPEQLWAIQASDTSANRALTRRPADEVVAASWLFTVFAVLSVGGVAASYAAIRGSDRARVRALT